MSGIIKAGDEIPKSKWWDACQKYTTNVGCLEYHAQRKANKAGPEAFRYTPSVYYATLCNFLATNDKDGFAKFLTAHGKTAPIEVG